MTPDSSEAKQFETFKRWSFLIGLPLGAVAALVSFFAERAIHPVDTFSQVIFLLLAGWLLLLALAAVLMQSIPRKFEYLLYISLNVFFITKLAQPLLIPDENIDAAAEVTALGYWYPVLYALAFVMFGLRRGIRLSLPFYGITLVMVGIILVQHLLEGDLAGHLEEFYALSQLVFSGGILILLYATSAKLTRLHANTAQSMRHLANTDSLTRVHSRMHIEALLEEEIQRARRYGRPLSVVLVDADRFKRVNDQHGHDVGDDVLREFAAILHKGIRRVDHVGRWGGEEFIIVLPELQPSEVQRVAERLRENVQAFPFIRIGTLTASFGVASLRPEDTMSSIIKRADEALYRAKTKGRNKVMMTQGQKDG